MATEHSILRRVEDHYHFTHSLIRHAFASRLSLQQRLHLHLNIALALDRHYAESPTSHALQIAHHLLEAGALADEGTLFRYAREAGYQAYSRFAWSEAARYFEAALSATDSAPIRATLHQRAGLSYYYNQDAGSALAHFEQAKVAYEALGNTPSLAWSLIWLVRLRLMYATVPIGVLPPHVDGLEAALATLDKTHLSLQGHIMTVLSQAYRHAREAVKGMDLAQTALAIGRRMEDDQLCAQASGSLGLAYLNRLQVEPAIASWQESLRFAQATDDLMLQMLPLTNLPHALNLQGSLEEGEAMVLKGVELTQAIQDWGERSKALSHLTSIASAKGHFQLVDQYAHDTMMMVERSGYPWGGFRALAALAGASAARGLWEEAHQTLGTMLKPGGVFESLGRVIQVFAWVFR